MTMIKRRKTTMPSPPPPPRSRRPALAALLAAAVVPLAPSDAVTVEVVGEAAAATTCFKTGDNSAAFASPSRIRDGDGTDAKAADGLKEYLSRCHVWPPTGVPPEHLDSACDRALQNAVIAADDAKSRAAPPEAIIPDSVYLGMAEERTWACPLDSDEAGAAASIGGRDGEIGALGHPTKWILYNEASTPVLLTHVNALGLEVSAADFSTYPAHADTAVWPHGPVVLPGQFAVVEGWQGQTFAAREYKEVLPMDAMLAEDDGPSWKSFVGALPPTLAYMPQSSRFHTNKGLHVMGHPGRVLMKHTMGNIYIRNQFGAVCPRLLGLNDDMEEEEGGRRGNPKDMNPDCNVLRKAFINKVGCPIDIYFAPQNRVQGYDCEKFTKHLGPLDTFLSRDAASRDIDAYNSPLKFENTYNGHSFVVRMSHDVSLVARIDIDHDIVRDCPEPSRREGVVAKVGVDDGALLGVWGDVATANATRPARILMGGWSAMGVNVNATNSLPAGKARWDHELLWQNQTAGVFPASAASISS